MRDVVEASREVPVLVDFWAPWCGPCRQLTPILEKAVRAAKGAVRLVKLNIDEHPQIPGQMGVQSIPAVFAFQDGRPVDGFMGALPEVARQRLHRAADRRHRRRCRGRSRSRRGGARRRRRQHRGADFRRDPASRTARTRRRSPASPSATSRPATSPAPSRRSRSCRRPRPRARRSRARAPRSSSHARRRQAPATSTSCAPSSPPIPKDAQARFDLALALNAKGDRDGALDELLDARRQEPRLERRRGAQAAGATVRRLGRRAIPPRVAGRQRLSSLLFA